MLPFNSRMANVFQGSDFYEIVNEMFAQMKTQIENPALKHRGFKFDELLFLDVNFHQLNLTRGSSYISQPSWISEKKAIINTENKNDEECFKWAVTAALHHEKIKSHPEHISNIIGYANNYNCSGLKFPVAINKINNFERNNDISINVLGVKGQDIYIQRKSKYDDGKKVVNLLPITHSKKRHYTTIKSLIRLIISSNSKYKCKQHFCTNCSQGFHYEESRNNHLEYCKDNEAVRIGMPKEGSFLSLTMGKTNSMCHLSCMQTLKQFSSQQKALSNPTLTQKNRTLKISFNASPLVSVCIASLLMERLKIH